MATVKQTYSFKVSNTGTEDKNVCLFAGNIPTVGLTDDATPVFTRGLVTAVKEYGLGAIDAVMVDGLSPESLTAGKNTLAKDGKGIVSTSLVTGRTIANFMAHLRSNSYLAQKLSIVSLNPGQMQNPISIGITVPTAMAKEERTITPDNQITSRSYQDNRAEFSDVNIWLQDDTLMYLKINAGEKVTITFTFTEGQN